MSIRMIEITIYEVEKDGEIVATVRRGYGGDKRWQAFDMEGVEIGQPNRYRYDLIDEIKIFLTDDK